MAEVKSVDPLGIKKFQSLPKVTTQEILFLGCSYTKGATLDSIDLAYPSLMSNQLNLNCRNYAQLGLNNYEMFDILSQIEMDDNVSVVLQLTELSRLKVYNESTKKILKSINFIPPNLSYLLK